MELCNNLVNPLFIRKQKQNTQFSPVSLRIAWLEDWESKVLQLLLHFFDSVFQFFRLLFLLFIDREATIVRGKYKKSVIIALSILALVTFPRR